MGVGVRAGVGVGVGEGEKWEWGRERERSLRLISGEEVKFAFSVIALYRPFCKILANERHAHGVNDPSV